MEMIQVKEAGESLNDNFESENNWFEREQCADEKYHGHHLTKNLKKVKCQTPYSTLLYNILGCEI